MTDSNPFWSISPWQLAERLGTSVNGLSAEDVAAASHRHGRSDERQRWWDFGRKNASAWRREAGLFLSQLHSPISLLLVGSACLSLALHESTDALLILGIVLVSVVLGFWQERSAANALELLQRMVKAQVTVRRSGCERELPLDEVLPGDLICLSAGATIPGDALLLEAKDLHVDESPLTGESFPVEKSADTAGGTVPPDAPLARRTNVVFQGTHVVSGTAIALVAAVGRETEFGRIADKLRLRPPETDFERGIRRFGYFLMQVTLLLVLCLFAVNVWLHKPVLESLLFALALAVGLTPQLLPAIVTVNLAHGASRMAKHQVILRRLSAIENFGCMNILCSDKTGTLTRGRIELHAAFDPDGNVSEEVGRLAFLTAHFETGFNNAIDAALREARHDDLTGVCKLDEVPYDFVRKRMSVLVEDRGRHLFLMKGALDLVLEACSCVELADGRTRPTAESQASLQARFRDLSGQGLRVLGMAYRDLGPQRQATKVDEVDMRFVGLLAFRDPPKADAQHTLTRMRDVGVALKMITGDNRWVAAQVAREVGLAANELLTGADLKRMSDTALAQRAPLTDVFAEVDPNQKERIILALKRGGHVVGYLGDGINDATALHAADVGISVDEAADVAKEAADVVLLQRDLRVLVDGILAGRQTFANTLKYIFMATSANFGNMFSMAGASLFLPFLPLLPEQILLANLLTDIPAMAIPGDHVAAEFLRKPRRWNMRLIRNFMLIFGVLSSFFDYMTFGVLLWVLQADEVQFRTGWFVESVVSASLIVLVIRTRRPTLQCRPSRLLTLATLGIVGVTFSLPWLSIAGLLGFAPLPWDLLACVVIVVLLYLLAAEYLKRRVLPAG